MDEAALKAYVDRMNEIAIDLSTKMPGLHPITLHVMASDIYSAERATERVTGGESAEQNAWLVGSFARWDWTLTMMAAGRITPEWFNENIVALWSGSDPDDTAPTALKAWQLAWAHNAGLIRDGRTLPRGQDGMITVYRGGPPSPDIYRGIAWTTDPKVARKFASGAGERITRTNGVVISGLVMRSQVLAYITGRHESEVIVDPRLVRGIKIVGAKA